MLVRTIRLPVLYSLLFLIIFYGTYTITKHLFAIQDITVFADNIQVQIDPKLLPKTLLFFPSEKLRTEILADNPILANIRFDKKYPHTLVIVPTLRQSIAILITPTRRVSLDENGIVLADIDSTPEGIPQIFASIESIRIGQQISDIGVRTSLTCIQTMQPLVTIDTISLTDDGLVRAHAGTLDILFTQDANIQAIYTTLQTLLTGFRIKGTLPSVIDLRFDKPVVTF